MGCLSLRGRKKKAKSKKGTQKKKKVILTKDEVSKKETSEEELEEQPEQQIDSQELEPQSTTRKRKSISEAKTGVQKKARKNTPFSIPPSKLKKKTFEFCNPFINSVSSDDFDELPGDKVCDQQHMDGAVLAAAILAMFPIQHTMSRAFKEASTEMGTRALHLAVAAGFRCITAPRTASTCASAREIVQQLKKRAKKERADEKLQDDNEDLCIAVGGDWTILSGAKSNESLNVRHEGDDGEDEDVETKYDLNFVVHDKRIKGLDKKVTVLVVDCKNSNVTKGIWQVSTYGCKYAVSNMEKGRFDPIFLELWGDKAWRYAMLTPMGIVIVENGQVSGSSGTSSTDEELNDELQSAKKRMNQSYPGAEYPDGCYVAGLLYVSKKKFLLSDFVTQRFTNVEDIRLFYESKMRMIVGDKVLQWTLEDVNKRIAVRKEEEKRALDNLEKALLNITGSHDHSHAVRQGDMEQMGHISPPSSGCIRSHDHSGALQQGDMEQMGHMPTPSSSSLHIRDSEKLQDRL